MMMETGATKESEKLKDEAKLTEQPKKQKEEKPTETASAQTDQATAQGESKALTPMRIVGEELQKLKPVLEDLLKSDVLTADRMLKIYLRSIGRSQKLRECTVASLAQSMIASAELGLELGGPSGHAYPVPYWNKHISRLECQMIIGYKGMIYLAKNDAGERVKGIESHLVYEKDQFDETLGHPKSLIHVPARSDRGRVVGAYAICYFRDAEPIWEFMDIEQLEKIHLRSPAKDDGPWKTDTEEMWRKCPVRRLWKYLQEGTGPGSRLSKAIAIEDRAESGEGGDILDLIEMDDKFVPKDAKRSVSQPQRQSQTGGTGTQPAGAGPAAGGIPNPGQWMVASATTPMKGGRGQSAWTLWKFKAQDGTKFATFDETISKAMGEFKKTGKKVEIVWEAGKYDDLMIVEIKAADDKPQPAKTERDPGQEG
jgi:recombination protein RecT